MVADDRQIETLETGHPQKRGLWPKRWRARFSLLILIIAAATLLVAWFSRERIAGNVIDDLLEQYDLPATYDIVSINPQRQVIANLVIGDPAAPDFTAERVRINLDYGFRTPTIEGVEITRPRLYGRYVDGKLSFGSLDRVIFTDSDEPTRLPDLDVAIIDGRALIESEYGAIAIKLDGAGRLDDGFAGTLAATAPQFGPAGCNAQSATMFGEITTSAGSPSFAGPVRLRGVACGEARLASADFGTRVSVTEDFSGAAGSVNVTAQRFVFDQNSLGRLTGDMDFNWGPEGLNIKHDLTGQTIRTPYAALREAELSGSVRTDGAIARSEWNSDIKGEGLQAVGDTLSGLSAASQSTQGTLIAPLLEKLNANLSRQVSDAGMEMDLTVRQSDAGLTVLVPNGRVTSRTGASLLALSRIAWAVGDNGTRVSGNFSTGGEGLPQITGRMEQTPGGGLVMRARMAEYSAGSDRLAVPQFQLRQTSDGGYDFTGMITATGALPDGRVRGLELPVEGSWNQRSGLALGRRCSVVRFDALTVSQLSLAGQRLALCPKRGSAIVRYKDSLQVGIETRSLSLTGMLGSSAARISAGAASFSYPGGFNLSDVSAVIGSAGREVRLTAVDLNGTVGEEIGGAFAGATAALEAVPLDLSQMTGRWVYSDEKLEIEDGNFLLTERVDGVEIEKARFEPMTAQGATLSLSDGKITAQADLRHRGSGRLITRVDVDHNLDTGIGLARLDVPGVVFDEQLRPQDLTYLTQGVVAYADGTISGQGEIRWNGDDITSTGTFGTDDLDLAASFGPIRGIKGTIEFTDLLGLTTAPGQVLDIGSINPGIEVLAGKVQFSLSEGKLIGLEDARWPFMGGTLILRPVDIRYGEEGPQRYVLEIVGLDAAIFVAQMELSNISATGIFDGTVPITFDDEGNGTIDGGLLISRPPGGNVSYVGELTYEDMGAIANYAFQSLRSLDYRQMSIGLAGSLSGEIITSFKIDGVRQGEGADRNFVTRRLEKLPIRFNINVRSQNFYQLATMVRSFFDPTYLGNPVDRGLLRVDDGRFVPDSRYSEPQDRDKAQRDDEPTVQPSESDNTP